MRREEFLARLGTGAAGGGGLPDLARLPASPTELLPGEDRFERFVAEQAAVAAGIARVGEAEVGLAVCRALAAHDVRRVALGVDLGRHLVTVTAALVEAGIDAVAYATAATDRSLLDALDATVTGCSAAVAATGSIVTAATTGRGAALIAPVHVCVVRAEQVVDGLADLLATAPDLGGGSLLALQSGPSRTADIEKVLILGVHGPRSVHVVLVG